VHRIFTIIHPSLPSQLTHLMRAVSPHLAEEYAKQENSMVCKAIFSILDIREPTAHHRTQLALPARLGGFGVQSLANTRLPHYVAPVGPSVTPSFKKFDSESLRLACGGSAAPGTPRGTAAGPLPALAAVPPRRRPRLLKLPAAGTLRLLRAPSTRACAGCVSSRSSNRAAGAPAAPASGSALAASPAAASSANEAAMILWPGSLRVWPTSEAPRGRPLARLLLHRPLRLHAVPRSPMPAAAAPQATPAGLGVRPVTDTA